MKHTEGQDDRETARRQATLDELTRAARRYEATAESFPVPASGDPDQPAGRRAERPELVSGDQPAAPAPRLHLVTAGPVDGQPDAQVSAAEES